MSDEKKVLEQLKDMDTDVGTIKSDRYKVEVPKTEEDKIADIHGDLDVLHDIIGRFKDGEITKEEARQECMAHPFTKSWIQTIGKWSVIGENYREPKPWEPRVSSFGTDDFKYERYAAGINYCSNESLNRVCAHLKISRSELNFIREHPRYLKVVRARIEKVGIEGLIKRSKRWSDIAKVYASYYRVKVRYIRQMLNDIDSDILESSSN